MQENHVMQEDHQETSRAQGFELFLARANQLATRFDGVPQHLRFLMLFTLLSVVWLWFLLFANAASWLQVSGALFFLAVVIPLFFVYQLYGLSQTILALPVQVIGMRDRLEDHESIQAFALAEVKNRTDVLNAFTVLRELRGFLKASGGIAGLGALLKLRFIHAVNPLISLATFASLAICWLISLIAVISLIVYLLRI